jgi:hypothetical protein
MQNEEVIPKSAVLCPDFTSGSNIARPPKPKLRLHLPTVLQDVGFNHDALPELLAFN